MYLVNAKWRYPFELQLIQGTVVVLEKEKKVRPKAKPKPKVKHLHAEISGKNVLRRSRRARTQTKFYGR